MTNAKKELICALEGNLIIAAKLEYLDQVLRLRVGYSPLELESFLNSIDFDYDDSYGTQYLYGTVWLSDGRWLERGEYDGSEWWELQEVPPIPEELK